VARVANLGRTGPHFDCPGTHAVPGMEGEPVLLILGLVVLLVLLCVSGVAMWARLAAANRRIIDAPEGEYERVFHGGVMARHIITSGLLVRLELYEWGVRLRGMVISRWVIPTWEARYDELAIAELVALPASRIGIWFRLRGQRGGIAFLSDHNLQILPLLERHGVQVNRSVTTIRRVEELYG
jgi:hypothetical protein